MVTTKLNLSMTEPSVRQIYAKQGDTGRVLDIALDQTPEDGTLRILRPDGVEVTSEAVTGGEVESGGTFESLTEADVTELTVGIEPVQDLNGFDKPWVGGAGKNKLVLLSESIKSLTSPSTWSGNVCTLSGMTYTLNMGNGDNVTSITINGTTTSYPAFPILISGLVEGQSYTIYRDGFRSRLLKDETVVNDGSHDYTFTAESGEYRLVLFTGATTITNVTVQLMVCLSSESSTWQPYSNICPITGHDEVTVTDEGTNLLNYDAWKSVSITRGTAVFENNGVTLTATDTDCFTEWSNAAFPQGARVSVAEGETITLAWELQRISGTSGGVVYIFPNGATTGMITTAISNGSLSYTATSGVSYISFRFGISNTGTTVAFKNIQIVRGTTVPTWTPYVAPHTYTTSLGQTVYGGTLDMVSGVLTVTHGNIASYNGETLPSTWISDRDVYASGTTPTTGAQVVYELATPLTYTLTPQQVKTLVGTNNVWASSGQIVNITFTYGGLLSELPSDATEIVGKCYCDVEQNGVSSMPFTLNVKKNERQ